MVMMEKDEFVLKVQPLTDLFNDDNHEWARELYEEDGYRISITAWDPVEGYMIDQHITGWYPELENLGIEELAEGDMYTAISGVSGLVSALRRMGFRVELLGQHSEPVVKEPSVDELEAEMLKAVDREDYMNAARLRDRIRDILKKERE
jgi:hypothetical protein